MKKIPFEYFGANQEIYFDIGRYSVIEGIAQKPIGDIVNMSLNVTNLAILISVGLQHYGRKDAQWYMQKMQALIDDGVEINEIQTAVVKAIIGSGILGRAAYLAAFPEEATEAGKKAAAEEIKN
jgi:hypothetical protein